MTTATPHYTIREATEQDVPEILAMVKELAIHTNNLSKVSATEEQLLKTLTFAGSAPGTGFARTFLVFPIVPDSTTGGKILPTHRKGIPLPKVPPQHDKKAIARPAGMALFFTNYSTWWASPGIYLEDLFVRKEYRGKGYGRALISALARETASVGGKRLEWGVQGDNTGSIAFYESSKIGAKRQGNWFTYRVDGEELDKLMRDDGQGDN